MTRQSPMHWRMRLVALVVVVLIGLGASTQTTPSKERPNLGLSFKNDRLKTIVYKDRPICCSTWFREADGIWESESKDPGKTLIFPQQVKISCRNYGNDDRKCVEIIVTLAAVKTMVSLQEIDTEEYDIDRWDEHGLIASYGGDESSQCQRHVLTMDFESGAVSVSDIPTHKKGCEAFRDTDSYRLVRGNYYVDTSPNNDMDKPVKVDSK